MMDVASAPAPGLPPAAAAVEASITVGDKAGAKAGQEPAAAAVDLMDAPMPVPAADAAAPAPAGEAAAPAAAAPAGEPAGEPAPAPAGALALGARSPLELSDGNSSPDSTAAGAAAVAAAVAAAAGPAGGEGEGDDDVEARTRALLRGASALDLSRLLAPVVICGPSGVGKGTIIAELMKRHPSKFAFCVSHTTRGPRPGEANGQHYHFVDMGMMQRAVAKGAFLEHAHVHGNL